jgi:hypothetical protein
VTKRLRRFLVVVALTAGLLGVGGTASANAPFPEDPDRVCTQLTIWSLSRPTLCVPVFL